MELMMRSPEKRFPDFENIPDIEHPDRFLKTPSLTIITSVYLRFLMLKLHYQIALQFLTLV